MDAFRRTHCTECTLKLQGCQRLTDRAMARQHTLCPAGGARGVENQRRIIGIDLHLWCAQSRCRQQGFIALTMGFEQSFFCQSDHDGRQSLLSQVLRKQLQARLITQQQAGAAVLQAME